MPCLLACGAEEDGIDTWCWRNMDIAVDFKPIGDWVPPNSVRGMLNAHHGLFTSYYGLVWSDLSGLHDPDGVDLWANARRAALFNRDVCRLVWAGRSKTYSVDNGGWWGLSAGDSPAGYVVPDPCHGDPDGTVWPTAALGAFPWAADELSADVGHWKRSTWWDRCRGKYGLSPFSVDKDWVGPELISIDIGSFAANWWNWRDGKIRRHWMSHPVSKRGIERLEFSGAVAR
jgi:hypothetical protein